MGWTKIDPIAPRLTARIDGIAIGAINDTTAAAAISAKQNHPSFKNRTGALEGSFMSQPAQKTGPTTYRGVFGSFDINYAIFQEIGTRFIRAGFFLRRAADSEFPRIGQRVKARMR